MANVNYSDGAGLYPCKDWKRRTRISYRRFDSVAEAVQFAIEEMPASLLRGSILEVNETRFEGSQIRVLYDAREYPLMRREEQAR